MTSSTVLSLHHPCTTASTSSMFFVRFSRVAIALLAAQVLPADRLKDLLPLRIRDRANHHVAILGIVGAERGGAAELVADSFGDDLECQNNRRGPGKPSTRCRPAWRCRWPAPRPISSGNAGPPGWRWRRCIPPYSRRARCPPSAARRQDSRSRSSTRPSPGRPRHSRRRCGGGRYVRSPKWRRR